MRLLLLAVVAVALALPAVARAELVRAPDIETHVHTGYKVYCRDGEWPYPEAAGYALIAEGKVLLHENVCAWLRHEPVIGIDFAKALFVILHELAHVGWQNPDEAAADCFALFTFRWEARHNFGFSREDANSLYELAWQAHLTQPQPYQGCAHLARDPIPD